MSVNKSTSTVAQLASRWSLTARHLWVWYGLLNAAAIVAYYLLPRAGAGQSAVIITVNAAAVAATVVPALRARGSTRMVWIALGCAMGFETAANIPYYATPLITGRSPSFPSAIDVLFLLTYPCYIVALLALGRHRRHIDRRGDLLDAALLTVGGGTLMWVFVIGPVVQAPAESLLAHVVSVAYPSLDLAVFAVFVRLMVSGLHRSTASRLLLGGFVALLAGDMVYAVGLLTGTYTLGGPTDALWMTFYALTGAAALHPLASGFPRAAPSHAFAVTRSRLAFLGASALVGPSLIVFDIGNDLVIGIVSVLSFLIVMARLTGLNWRLQAVGHELEQRAATDALTGLRNRPALTAALASALSDGHRDVTLLLVDLDDFKQVNDLAGHSAGDTVLVEAARRMQSVLRAGDVIARLGGDEFAVLVSSAAAKAARLGERLIDELHEPFVLDGRTFNLGASVGVVTANAGTQPERLVQDADIAMYAAKRAGRNRVVVFEDAMYADIVQRSDFRDALAGAVARGEMHLEYQPIVHLDTRVVVGVEALARWRHPSFGDVSPSQFIPIAEESGAIVPLGRWLLQQALHDLAALDRVAPAPLTVNVNVSAVQLLDHRFAADVAAALDASGVDSRRLIIELTEGALVRHGSEAAQQLAELGALGVSVAIDDFGTGYSSLAYLQRLPVGEVKIDRSFVDRIDRETVDNSLARAILRMCDALGLRCIAEGVEREDQVTALRAAGGILAQGFLFGRPMVIADVAATLGAGALGPPLGACVAAA